jgi:hypothetical protein
MVRISNGRDWHTIESESRTVSGFRMCTVLKNVSTYEPVSFINCSVIMSCSWHGLVFRSWECVLKSNGQFIEWRGFRDMVFGCWLYVHRVLRFLNQQSLLDFLDKLKKKARTPKREKFPAHRLSKILHQKLFRKTESVTSLVF